MADGVHPVIGLRHLLNVQGVLHHGGNTVLLQHIAHGKGVHGGAQHPHVIRTGAFQLALAVFHTAPEISSSYHQRHLSAGLHAIADGLRHRIEHCKIQSGPGLTGQSLTADLQENSPIFGSFHNDLRLFQLSFLVF